jgi:hypothetical protein
MHGRGMIGKIYVIKGELCIWCVQHTEGILRTEGLYSSREPQVLIIYSVDFIDVERGGA